MKKPVIVIGQDRIAHSVAVCLLTAGHPVAVYTTKVKESTAAIGVHMSDLRKLSGAISPANDLTVTSRLESNLSIGIAFAITGENLALKKNTINELEQKLADDAIIAINTESIPLLALQQGTRHPARIIGVNWVEPAHTTLFLEIISSVSNDSKTVGDFASTAKLVWNKDPYIVENLSVRARIMAAMLREAAYLVENGYASFEDIDRACRNDAGYYLPFAGHFRYMDLMGTYAYGMVMQELNQDLSKTTEVPRFLEKIIGRGGLGMKNNRGFYNYAPGDSEKWDEIFRQFSYRIQKIILKYPFNNVARVSA